MWTAPKKFRAMRCLFLCWLLGLSFATAARAREFTVLVYNVENLAAADGRTLSDDYRPKLYSRTHLMTKLNNIAKICAQFEDGNGPDIILFQEIERGGAQPFYGRLYLGVVCRPSSKTANSPAACRTRKNFSPARFSSSAPGSPRRPSRSIAIFSARIRPLPRFITNLVTR